MTKVTLIIGEPATGKSELVKQLMRWTYPRNWIHHQIPYLHYHFSEPHSDNGKVCIIGRYDDPSHKFPGTDRLSMACQPRAIKLIREHPEWNYVIEGDRLGNMSFIQALVDMKVDLQLIHLTVSDNVLNQRRLRERQDQNVQFVRSRKTKIKNIVDASRGKINHGQPLLQTFINDSSMQMEVTIRHIMGYRL